MRKTILWGALLAVGCMASYADTPAPADAKAPVAPPVAPMVTATTPAPSPLTINCDLKLANTGPVSESVLLTWSEKAAIQSFDFSPDTIDAQMQKLKACYTNDGWVGYNEALKKSGNLDAIKSQHLTVSSQVDGQTKLFETKDNQWKLSLPLQVVYQNDKEKVTQLLTVQLTIGRKPTGELGIAQMVATPRTSDAQTGNGQANAAESSTGESGKDAQPTTTPDSKLEKPEAEQ